VYLEIDRHSNLLPIFINSKSLLYLLEVFNKLEFEFVRMPILTALSIETHLYAHSFKLRLVEIDVQLIVILHYLAYFLNDTKFVRHLLLL
jgi:hypothetical protein